MKTLESQLAYGNSKKIVLAVDLDGTLTFTDTLYESLICLLRKNPLYLLVIPFWLFRGKAVLKAKIADRINLDITTLPYNEDLILWLKEERLSGKLIVLCTASHIRIAQAIADHLNLFDQVMATDGITNNSGANKKALLDANYGNKGYDYVGNSLADLIVWAGAKQAIVVNASEAIILKASRVTIVSKIFQPKVVILEDWYKALRVHQWLKNLLVFVPLIAAHQIDNFQAVQTLTLAFISFSLCASAVYITNDLFDLESDRKHPRKYQRPFASAKFPIHFGVVLALLFILISLSLGLVVNEAFTTSLIIYFTLTFIYSLWLKRFIIVDCLTLAILYTLRIIAGSEAVAIKLSFWLFAFSIFIFLSLAFVKRYSELQTYSQIGNSNAHGRGYLVTDAPLIQIFGITAGYASVLVLALYLQSDTVITLYAKPQMIWFAVPLILFWVSWVWMKAHRGEMHDDPIAFAIKDKASLTVGVLIAFSFFIATKGITN